MVNIFDWLEQKYNSNEKYKNEFNLTCEEFINLFFENTFNINTGSIHEGFIAESDVKDCYIGNFIPNIKLDFKNKTIEMFNEEDNND